MFSYGPADVQSSTFYFILVISYEPGCGCELTFFNSSTAASRTVNCHTIEPMKTLLTFLLCQIVITTSHGQNHRNLSTYLLPEFSQTLSDRTKWNNEYGLGLGIQTFWRATSTFTPFVQVSDDFIFLDDKVLRTNPDGTIQITLENVAKVIAGTNIKLIGGLHISLAAGASFTGRQTLFTIKPGIGLLFGKNDRWILKTDYFEMYNRYSGERQNYTSLVFSLGIRLF
jgi:hypothetical protein